MATGRFDSLLDYVTGRWTAVNAEQLTELCSIEVIGYEIPNGLYGLLVRFRHLNRSARIATTRAYLQRKV